MPVRSPMRTLGTSLPVKVQVGLLALRRVHLAPARPCLGPQAP